MDSSGPHRVRGDSGSRPNCKTRENSNFMKKGKMVILVKIKIFSRSRMTKRIHCWNRLAKSSYHVEFR